MKHMKALSPILIVLLVLCTAGGCRKPIEGTMTDARDGQEYTTVELGDQTWMAQNLNYETANSWCYDNDTANCDVYGRLYNFEAAMGACPDGWHLGTDQEWEALVLYIDPGSVPNDGFEISKRAGGMMKTRGTIEAGTGLWSSPNTGATNSSRFSALPGGTRNNKGTYKCLGANAMFWTATEDDATYAWTMYLDMTQSNITRDNRGATKQHGLSVRCIMD